jgi:5-methylthioribose kinase
MSQPLRAVEASVYRALTPETVPDYLAAYPDLVKRIGGKKNEWDVREVGDGNLNLVFIVTGPEGRLCLKQALPYVRLVGESWPLPLSRAHFEYAALVEETRCAPNYVPALYHHDTDMALTVMECLSPHIILRKGLIKGIKYPDMAKHLGEFLALTLFGTSDLNLPAAEKKKAIAHFAGNTAMCKISEDLIFDEPYYQASNNRHTKGLEDIAQEFQKDAALKNAAQDMKWKFLNHAEALLHGDLHTGSVMVTETDTRAIDPEFAFYGPMGFDVGAIIANLLLAAIAQEGHAEEKGKRSHHAAWILAQIPVLWENFATTFTKLWNKRDAINSGGDVFAPLVAGSDDAIQKRLHAIWNDALGFAGMKMIRRILGLAHVEDFESIEDTTARALCERKALTFARSLLLNRDDYPSVKSLIERVQV